MGFVYILSNEVMPDLVKIGRTETSVLQRMSEINKSTGVPVPFICEFAAKVEDSFSVERHLHQHFSEKRINSRREFFKVSVIAARNELVKFMIEDATPSEELIDEHAEDSRIALTKLISQRRLPTFSEYGIPQGSVLEFSLDQSLKVIVKGERSVMMDSQLLTMSGAANKAMQLLGRERSFVSGPNYWMYQGETIYERYSKLKENRNIDPIIN